MRYFRSNLKRGVIEEVRRDIFRDHIADIARGIAWEQLSAEGKLEDIPEGLDGTEEEKILLRNYEAVDKRETEIVEWSILKQAAGRGFCGGGELDRNWTFYIRDDDTELEDFM